MGRLVRDPEVRYSQGAEPLAVARYTLAVNRVSNVKASRMPTSSDALHSAKPVSLRKNTSKKVRWSALSVGCRYAADDNEGKKRWSTDVVVEEQYFAESKASFESHKDAAPAATAPAPKQTAPSDGFYPIDESIEDDDLPF